MNFLLSVRRLQGCCCAIGYCQTIALSYKLFAFMGYEAHPNKSFFPARSLAGRELYQRKGEAVTFCYQPPFKIVCWTVGKSGAIWATIVKISLKFKFLFI